MWGRVEVLAGFWWGNLRERTHMKGLGVDGRILLKWILKTLIGGWEGMDWIDLTQETHKWLAVVNTIMTLGVP